MAFDLSTATPLGEEQTGGFDLSTATPIGAQPQKKGFMSRLGSDFDARINTSSNISKQNITEVEKRLGYAGQGMGMAADVIKEGLSSAYDILPGPLQEVISGTGNAILDATPTIEKAFPNPMTIREGIKSATQKYGQFEKANPRLSNVTNAVGNATDLGINLALVKPTADVIGYGASKAGEGIGSISGKAATGLENIGIKPISKVISDDVSLAKLTERGIKDVDVNVLNDVSPKYNLLTKTERQQAAAAGGVERQGVLVRSEQLKTTTHDIEVAKAAEGVYFPQDHWTVKVDKLHGKIGELAEKTEALPARFNTPIDSDVLSNALKAAKEERRIAFAGDTAIENAYDNAVKTFTSILDKKQQTLSSVLEARKEYYALMKNKPKVFDRLGTVQDQAAKDVGRAANQFIYEALPEGNKFKELLRQQHNIYKAIDGISVNNTAEIGKSVLSKVGQAIRTHPFLTAEAGTAVLGGGAYSVGMGGAIVSVMTPVALTALATYGTYRVGKMIVTSRMVRESLTKFLRATERTLSPAEKEAIKKTILYLPPGSQDFVFKGRPSTLVRSELAKDRKLIGGSSKPDYIDAIFTSWSRPIPERPALDIPRRDAILELPAGQGFNVEGRIVKGAQGEPFKLVGGENVKLKGLRNYQKALKRKAID